ncbi:MAG: enoyl-CoA hydratase/isomerase family protein [Geminicoccaceae bacterium]
MDSVRVERQGEVARVTLDRPGKLNAVNNAMWDRLGAVFAELDADQALRCVIIGGAGERAFSVGADIAEFEENRSSVEQARSYARRTHAALAAIARCRHPVIAEIRGLCVGGGLELATCCDLRIAGEGARFGIPVKRLGLVVAYAELKPLVDLIGPANAMEILLEGEVFGAQRAYDMGLINRIVPDDALAAEVEASAARICEGAPLVARWHKKFTRRLLRPEPLSPAELDESYHCFGTEDFQAGYKAFLAKSKPEFRGR